MNRYLMRLFLVFGVASAYIGCSEVEFKAIPDEKCAEVNSSSDDETCVIDQYGNTQFADTIRVGKVDILFVDDNSGSMHFEQERMAQRFDSFIDSLDNDNIDYNIGIITTDISTGLGGLPARQANGFGKLQDGKFIEFSMDGINGYGVKVITDEMNRSDKIQLFSNTIKRPESVTCFLSNFVASMCPSGDERGIYALNMALDRGNTAGVEFFRGESHLAVVILSDEDERGKGTQSGSFLALEPYDLPSTFVSKVAQQLGSKKTVSVHPIVINPGDTSCKAQQDAQGNLSVKGEYGEQYAMLGNPDASLMAQGNIVQGTIGNICASSYGSQLQNIAKNLSETMIQLRCKPVNDENSELTVVLDPEPQTSVTYSVNSQNVLTFSPSILPSGTEVYYSYSCASLLNE